MAVPFTITTQALKPPRNLVAGRCWPRFRSLSDAIGKIVAWCVRRSDQAAIFWRLSFWAARRF